MDSTEIATLVNYAENSTGRAAVASKGILEFAYDYHYCDCIVGDTTAFKSSGITTPESFDKVFGAEVSVHPNPAQVWTAFDYTLANPEDEALITITDISGKLVERFVVSGQQGQKVWDTRRVEDGVYYYTFKANGSTKVGKIVITK